MEVIIALIGLGLVAAAPRIWGLRPVAKVVIKAGMDVTEATVTVTAIITGQVNELVARAHADHADHANGTAALADGDAVHAATGTATAALRWLDNTDLLQIDGIGPKVSGHLKSAGVQTITQLAATRVERLQAILDAAGPRFGAIDSSTWPEQAQALLTDGQA